VTDARARAYAAIDVIDWPGGFYPHDIGWRAARDLAGNIGRDRGRAAVAVAVAYSNFRWSRSAAVLAAHWFDAEPHISVSTRGTLASSGSKPRGHHQHQERYSPDSPRSREFVYGIAAADEALVGQGAGF
jgi:hypothetical protein